MKTLFLLAVIAALCLPAHAQTWFTVTSENPSQSIVFPVGTTYRFGNVADNKWNPNVVSTSTAPVLDYTSSQPADPDPNVLKVFQVLETSAAQSIQLVVAATGNGAGNPISTVTVPIDATLAATAKITPTITWAVPAWVVSGTALSATQLNAVATASGAAVPGTFAYTPASGKVVTATTTLAAVFTPTDTTHYATAKASVSLTVRTPVSSFPATCTNYTDMTFSCTATGPVVVAK